MARSHSFRAGLQRNFQIAQQGSLGLLNLVMPDAWSPSLRRDAVEYAPTRTPALALDIDLIRTSHPWLDLIRHSCGLILDKIYLCAPDIEREGSKRCVSHLQRSPCASFERSARRGAPKNWPAAVAAGQTALDQWVL